MVMDFDISQLLFSQSYTVIDGNDIVYRDYIDISVAVATPKVCVQECMCNMAIII